MEFEKFCKMFDLSLTPRQRRAVCATEGPVLLLAVPGSGKTQVLITRIGYMIYGKGIPPYKILTMTYTRAATADMRDRFCALFGQDFSSLVEFRTINGLSRKIIKRYEQLFHTKAFELVSEEGAGAKIISDIFRRVTGNFATESDIKDIRLAITYAKNMMLRDSEITRERFDIDDFDKIYQAYKKYMVSNRLMDFDDQMVYARTILKRYPEILEEFQEQYQYICVDEAQDTSRIQHEIINLLAAKRKNIFMVGDEDQSIYGFRAAYPRALIDFSKTYPGAQVMMLEKNFRSTPEIVDISRKIIAKNKNRYDKKMTTDNPHSRPVKLIPALARFAQYRYLLTVAMDCKETVAVLFRNNESAIPLVDLLERNGLPYSIKQSDGAFFSHRAVRDIVNILRFAIDPYDRRLFMDIYYKTNLIMSKNAALQVCEVAASKGKSILAAIPDVEEADHGKRTTYAISNFKDLTRDRPAAAIDRIVKYMGYGRYMSERGTGAQKIQILQQVALNEKNITSFLARLEEIAALMSEGASKENKNFILSTIHSSKGLEYDTVYLLDVIDGVLPAETPEEDEVQKEEERRLLYVAMTRAKNKLCIFDLTQNESSCYTDEIKEHLTPPDKKSAKIKVSKAPKTLIKANVGDYIKHIQYGIGEITSVDGDVVFVKFNNGIEKVLMLSFATKKGMAELIRNKFL